MQRGPLSLDEAVRLFASRAADARGSPVIVTEADHAMARYIVELLSLNRAAIVMAGARAAEMTPEQIARTLEQLDMATEPEPEVRSRLARGESRRRLGRLGDAATDLEAVLRDAQDDPHGEAEAHRLLGGVYRAQGRPLEALAHKEKALALFSTLGDPVRRAVAHGEVGTALAALGRLREARLFHEQALAAHRELGSRGHEGVELSYLGVTLHRLGRIEEARRAHEAALAIHHETGNRRHEGADRLHLGYVAHELGELDAARASFDQALAILREVGDRALEGVTLSYAGALEVEAKRPEVAGALLQQALAIHAEVDSPRHEAVTWMHLAAHHAALGETDASVAALERFLALGEARVETEQRAWVLALLGRFEEARAIDVEDAHTQRAIELVEAATTVREGRLGVSDAQALLARSRGEGAPVSNRLRRACAALESALAGAGASLEIAADGRWFKGTDGVRVDLARRRPLRLALMLLVDRRLSAPGEGVPWQALLSAGWPDERVQAEAGFSRVRNALFQLRKMGIRDALLTRDDGYLLDPAVRVRRET